MIIPKKQTWKGWLAIGIVFTIFGILYYLNGNDIIVSLFFGFLFLCIAYSSYNFSKKRVVRVGRNLTIFFLILLVMSLFLGYFEFSGEISFIVLICLIYWYFENKQIIELIEKRT